MNNKRLLLLGITVFIMSSGWMYPDLAAAPTGDAAHNLHHLLDTEKVAKRISVTAVADSNSVGEYKDLFVATTLGGTNGVRLNPNALSFVQDYMKDNWDELQSIRMSGKSSFNLIEHVLTSYGLPKELKYLAVIESNLKSTAVSKVGAVGPWQLMPQTARELGLKVSRGHDERKNYYKSTVAAALYLRDLYNELGDWLLVIASYNCGTVNVYRAIHRSGSRNFWDLQYFLPAESRIHVKKFIGTQYTFEGQGSVTTLTKQEAKEQLTGSSMYVFARKLSPEEFNNSRSVVVTGKYYASVIARYTMMDLPDFIRYNPDFDKVMASSNNSYELKLPADKMELFAASKYQILTESVEAMRSEDSTSKEGLAAK